MIEVRVSGKLRYLPQSWADLKQQPKNLKKVFKLFGKNLEPGAFLLSAALSCIGVKSWHWQRVKTDTAVILMEQMTFLLEAAPSGLDENPFPRIGRMVGTEKPFDHLGTWEFSLVEKHFLAYAQTQSLSELCLFMAAWYRPRRWFAKKNGDRRTDFNDTEYRFAARKFRRVPVWKMQMIWQYFLRIREIAIELHPHLFEGEETDAKSSWVDTIISLSTPGDEEKTSSVPIGLMLRRLENKAREYKEFVKKNKVSDEK